MSEATKKIAARDVTRLENAVKRLLIRLNIRVTFDHFKRSGFALTIPLLLTTVVLIWWCPSLFVPLVDETHPHSLYLLSAIAQSLAAVLALVFSISLVVAQLASRYSYRMLSHFFDRLTIAYILLFIVAVFLPFWLLAKPSPWGVKLSLTLAATSLLLLIPYFLSFRDKLNPERLIRDLQEEALRLLRNNPRSEPSAIVKLKEFIMTAFTSKDYDTFEKGVKSLAHVTLVNWKMTQDLGKDLPAANDIGYSQGDLLKRLRNIGLVTLEDPIASIKAIEILADIGSEASEKGLFREAEDLVKLLVEIGTRAAEKGLEDAVWWVAYSLERLGVSTFLWNRSTDASSEVVVGLLQVIGKTAEKRLDFASGRTFDSLGSIGSRAAMFDLRDWPADPTLDEEDKGFVRWVADSLGTCAIMASKNGLIYAPGRAAWHLWHMGTLATIKNNSDLKTEVVNSLSKIERQAGSRVVRSACRDFERYLAKEYKEYRVVVRYLEEVAPRDAFVTFKAFYDKQRDLI